MTAWSLMGWTFAVCGSVMVVACTVGMLAMGCMAIVGMALDGIRIYGGGGR